MDFSKSGTELEYWRRFGDWCAGNGTKKKKKIKKEKTKKRVACCFSFLFYPRAFMKLDIRFVSSLNNRWNYREGRPSAVLKLCQPRCNYYGSCCCTPNYEGSWLRSRIYPKFFRQLIFERTANVLRSVYLEIYFRDDRSRKNKIPSQFYRMNVNCANHLEASTKRKKYRLARKLMEVCRLSAKWIKLRPQRKGDHDRLRKA